MQAVASFFGEIEILNLKAMTIPNKQFPNDKKPAFSPDRPAANQKKKQQPDRDGEPVEEKSPKINPVNQQDDTNAIPGSLRKNPSSSSG
jgi:hypothetical protein